MRKWVMAVAIAGLCLIVGFGVAKADNSNPRSDCMTKVYVESHRADFYNKFLTYTDYHHMNYWQCVNDMQNGREWNDPMQSYPVRIQGDLYTYFPYTGEYVKGWNGKTV